MRAITMLPTVEGPLHVRTRRPRPRLRAPGSGRTLQAGAALLLLLLPSCSAGVSEPFYDCQLRGIARDYTRACEPAGCSSKPDHAPRLVRDVKKSGLGF